MWSRFRTPKNSGKKKQSEESWNADSPSLTLGPSDYHNLIEEMRADKIKSENKIASLEELADILKIEREAATMTSRCSTKALCEVLEEMEKKEIELKAEKMTWKAIAVAYASQKEEMDS